MTDVKGMANSVPVNRAKISRVSGPEWMKAYMAGTDRNMPPEMIHFLFQRSARKPPSSPPIELPAIYVEASRPYWLGVRP